MKDPQTVLNCSISEPTHPHLFVVWTYPSWICCLAHLKLNWSEATEENIEPVQMRAAVAAGSMRCWLDSWNMQLKYAANNHHGNKLINNKRKLQFYRCVLKEEPCLYPADTVPNILSHGSASFLDFLERLCCGFMSLQEGSRFKFSQAQGHFCMFSRIYAWVLTSHSSASGSKLPIGVNMPSDELSTFPGWILMLASSFHEQVCALMQFVGLMESIRNKVGLRGKFQSVN